MRTPDFNTEDTEKIHREGMPQSEGLLKSKDSAPIFSVFSVFSVLSLFGFYTREITGSPATTERYTSRTCSADRSHEYFWTSS
jgi:hypothetical protein